MSHEHNTVVFCIGLQLREQLLPSEKIKRSFWFVEHEYFWFAKQRSKKGYSGSATLTRKGLGFKHARGLGEEAYDVERRMIVSESPGFTAGTPSLPVLVVPAANSGAVEVLISRSRVPVARSMTSRDV